MRVAALYDIHGNLPALEAVLREVRDAAVDEIVVGGDVIPGPMPRATVEAVLALDRPARFLRGNGERETLALRRGEVPTTVPEAFHDLLRWTGAELSDEHAVTLEAWPETVRLAIPGLGDVLFCHATPRNDHDIFTARTPESALLPLFEPTGADVVVCGHTHMQDDRRVGSVRVVNAGSVGMPFGAPGAYWLLLEPGLVEPRHTRFDLGAAADRIRATTYPQAADFARGNVLEPPSEADMLELFGRAALALEVDRG